MKPPRPGETRAEPAALPSGSVAHRLLELQQNSRSLRTRATTAAQDGTHTWLQIDGSRFQIQRITDSKSAELGKTQQLLEQVFGKAETDSEEILRHTVRMSAVVRRSARTQRSNSDAVTYLVFNVKDEAERVVAALCGGILTLNDGGGRATGQTLFMVTYAVTSPTVRHGGLAREVYITALAEAALESAKGGRVLTFAAGECTSPSEPFWNRVGWQRVYRITGEGLCEVEYTQPILDFDSETGEPAQATGEVPEHLMIDGFGAQISQGDVIAIVAAFYRWYHWSPDDFEDKLAFARHSSYLKGLGARFNGQFCAGSECRTLTREQRCQLQGQGARIVEPPSR